jgi:hypothetical protein
MDLDANGLTTYELRDGAWVILEPDEGFGSKDIANGLLDSVLRWACKRLSESGAEALRVERLLDGKPVFLVEVSSGRDGWYHMMGDFPWRN